MARKPIKFTAAIQCNGGIAVEVEAFLPFEGAQWMVHRSPNDSKEWRLAHAATTRVAGPLNGYPKADLLRIAARLSREVDASKVQHHDGNELAGWTKPLMHRVASIVFEELERLDAKRSAA